MKKKTEPPRKRLPLTFPSIQYKFRRLLVIIPAIMDMEEDMQQDMAELELDAVHVMEMAT